jgi:GNAT superfamily N-acetyltransferase
MAMIRPAAPADTAAVREIVRTAYEGYIPRIGIKPGPMRADYAELIAAGTTWVAVDDDVVVGLVVLQDEPADLLLENIAVAPQAQGRGVGSQLMEFIEDEARRRGFGSIRLYTHEKMTENIAYYLRRGYVETHRTNQLGFDRLFFRKDLH